MPNDEIVFDAKLAEKEVTKAGVSGPLGECGNRKDTVYSSLIARALAVFACSSSSHAVLSGFFDPLGFYNGRTIRQKKKLREAELKHGRVAMLAVLGIFVQEQFHPFLGGGDIGPATEHFQEVSDGKEGLQLSQQVGDDIVLLLCAAGPGVGDCARLLDWAPLRCQPGGDHCD
jgi:hypothetical protein